MQKQKTRTGAILYDPERQLECLYVGDYGKENNIKADFLGLTKKIHGVEHSPVDLTKKMVVTISTQRGCGMNCSFCDVPKLKLRGNCDILDLLIQIDAAMRAAKEDTGVKHTERFNLHLARMGEPVFNASIINFVRDHLRPFVRTYLDADVIHPVMSTCVPNCSRTQDMLRDWIQLKNVDYNGEAGLQLSINSTSDEQREQQFGKHRVLPLGDIAFLFHSFLPGPVGRKYTLNFAVTKDTILDAKVLSRLFNKDDFVIKITPIHKTQSALENGYDVGDSYENYDVYEQFEAPLLDEGWDVIVFVPSKEEDEDRITCGNALLYSSALDN